MDSISYYEFKNVFSYQVWIRLLVHSTFHLSETKVLEYKTASFSSIDVLELNSYQAHLIT